MVPQGEQALFCRSGTLRIIDHDWAHFHIVLEQKIRKKRERSLGLSRPDRSGKASRLGNGNQFVIGCYLNDQITVLHHASLGHV